MTISIFSIYFYVQTGALIINQGVILFAKTVIYSLRTKDSSARWTVQLDIHAWDTITSQSY